MTLYLALILLLPLLGGVINAVAGRVSAAQGSGDGSLRRRLGVLHLRRAGVCRLHESR